MDAKTQERPALWTIRQVADYLGKSVPTLYSWRSRGLGPPARKVGGHLRYDPELIEQWLEDQPL